MKTCRQWVAMGFGLAAFWVLTSGCGARSAAPIDTAGSAAAETPGVPATNAAPEPQPADAPAGPVIVRAERSLPPLKPELAEVVRLIESGSGEEVTRAFVAVSPVAYNLSLEEIIYLRDIGVPDGVIAAMMRRGGELRDKEAETATMQTNLVSAVDQLRDALQETNQPGNRTDATAPAAPGEGAAADSSAAPPVQATAAPADAPEPVQQFYSDLSPYGSWYQVPTYGWVWQPSVVAVNPAWYPYRHGGRWLWSDAGWYWCSDYSWGWAPFHYGRWCTYPGVGWCWVPGSVWGPSWVTWRHCDGYIGWAPLPPACGWSTGVGLTWYGSGVSVGFGFGLASSCYSFVPSGQFCYRNVGAHCVAGPVSHSVYGRSTVVNNVIVGNNNTIVNNGIGYANVASGVRGEVPKVRVESLPTTASRPLRVDRLEREKSGLVVYKPSPVESAGGRPTSMRAEVRPANESRPEGGLPARTAFGSRFNETPLTAGAGKSIEPSAAGRRPSTSSAYSTTAGSRPMAPTGRTGSSSTYSVNRDNLRSSGVSVPMKNSETRQSSSTTTDNGSTTAGIAPRSSRQTMPVPLADPSRNIPSRLRTPNAGAAGSLVPNKSANEGRGFNSAASPSAAPSRSYQSVPQTMPSQTLPSSSYNRSPSYAPSRSVAPTMNVPSAPMSVPRGGGSAAPSFSAPSRPTMSAPSPVMSAPAPSSGGGNPSGGRSIGGSPSPAPSGGGSRSGRN